MKKLSMLVMLGFAANAYAAPNITDVEKTKSLCQDAAALFAEGNIKASMDKLAPHWPLPVEEIQSLTYQTESQLKLVHSRFGSSLGAEHVSSKKAGSSFVQHNYIINFDKHAIRYLCIFYKPKSNWLVNTVHWDDKTILLFNQ
ncbi:hypothetical protein ACT21L_004563 [Vibrio vulnificus]|nr:hypothetical protein [Vibrio vulnificus]ELI3524505.1 hypothetical protein [Vibrio vulnificus]